MSIIDSALNSIGINAGITDSFGGTAVGGAVNLFAKAVDSLSGSNIANSTLLSQATGGAQAVAATNGDWTAGHYANDLVNHAPKFKFLFKVLFSGFGTRDFYYYVTAVDKPRIRFNHADVNFYNFRSKVLTSVLFEPINITFLDETGDSVNQFFATYLKTQSGQGGGNLGINNGYTKSSSSLEYKNGYSQGVSITVEQIFGNGTSSNRFVFLNPRIESFDFDELSMEENGGSTMTVQFHYDGIQCSTVAQSTLYSWGNTDLLRGGGNDTANGGSSSLLEAGALIAQSATGKNITGLFAAGALTSGSLYSNTLGGFSGTGSTGSTTANTLPSSLVGLNPLAGSSTISAYNSSGVVDSSGTTINANMSNTLSTVQSGANLSAPNSFDAGSVNDTSSSSQFGFVTTA